MKISKTYIIIGIGLFIGFAIFYDWYSSNRFYDLLDSEGVYTIGTIEKVESLSKGGPLSHITYTYKNLSHEGEYIGDLGVNQKPYMGKRFFIKIIPNNPKIGIYFNPNFSVPDSILSAPPEGWSQDWMKEHFPDCVK
jgi:hypothetical protein